MNTSRKIAFPNTHFPIGSSACPVTMCNATTAYSISLREKKKCCTIKPSLWRLLWCLSSLRSTMIPDLDGLTGCFYGQKVQQDSEDPSLPIPLPPLSHFLQPPPTRTRYWASLWSDSDVKASVKAMWVLSADSPGSSHEFTRQHMGPTRQPWLWKYP